MKYKISPRKNRSVMFNGIWLQPGDSTLWNVPIDDPNLYPIHSE